MLNLDPRYIVIVQEILRQHIPDKIVWVYGSRIKGNSHAGSDLDLVIMPSHSELSDEQLSAVRNAFSESNLPILIDIMDWTQIPENFKTEIEKTHEIFQAEVT